MNNGSFVSPTLCAVSCFAATASFTTVPYFSMDEPRSITIAYNSDQASPHPFIYADVNGDDGSGVGINTFVMSATLNGNPVTWLTGGTNLTWSGALGWVRLSGQVDGTGLATNVYPLVVTVKANYADGSMVQKTVNASVIVVNEAGSPIAKGWTVTGVQKLYAGIASPFLITEGDGSGISFSALGVKAADYSRLTFDNASSTYTRTYNDGRRVIFNSVGQEISSIDLNGRTYTFSYDPQGRLQNVRDPYRKQPNGSPTSIGLSYDTNGLRWIQEPGADGTEWHGRTTGFIVDANRCLTSAEDPDHVMTYYTCDGSGRLSTITDRRGGVTTLGYTAGTWKLTQITLPQIAVDAGGGSTTLTNPVIHLAPWQGTTAQYVSNVQASVIDAAGRRTNFGINEFGQPVSITDPMGLQTTITTYGILPTRITHPLTGTDTLVYDTLGRVTKTHYAGQDSVKYSYLGFLLKTLVGPGNTTRTYYYNAGNQPDSIVQSGFPTGKMTFTYNASTLRPNSVSDEMKHKTVYGYDATFGNLDTVSLPGNRISRKVFDQYGRDSVVTPPVGAAQSTLYDIVNRVTSVTAGVRTISLGYDNLFQTDLYDANSNHYHTDYNALGWPISQCDASAKCVTTRYDASGAVMSTTNRRNQLVSVTRDAMGRITSRSGAGISTNNYNYNTNGHDMVAWNSVETDSISTNPGNYSVAERDSTITWIDGKRYQINHRYPRAIADNDSVTITSNTGTIFDPRVTIYSTSGFDSLFKIGPNVVTFAPNPDGTGGVFTYPNFSRTSAALSTHLTDSVSFNSGSLNNSFLRKYHYDLNGRIDQMTMENNPVYQTLFGYDALGRLTTREYRSACTLVGTDTTSGPNYSCPTLLSSQYFTYDAMGNRTDNGGVPTTGNRYVTFNGASYTYDADGNVARKYKAGVYDIYFYWNPLNQLDSVVKNGQRTFFEYNALGNPVRVKEGTSYPLTLQRYLLWDGVNLVAQLGPTGQRGVDYAYLPGATDHPFAYEHGATTPTDISYFEIDETNNIIGSSQSGSLRQDDNYDGWGVHSSNLPTDQYLFWKGLFWNGDNTGLYYMRNRWYDPEAGRFVSEDPAGFAGGDNLYTFAGNDPVNGHDSQGLTAQEMVCTVIDFPGFFFDSCGGGGGSFGPSPEAADGSVPPDQADSPPHGGGGTPSQPPKPSRGRQIAACTEDNKFSSLLAGTPFHQAAQILEVAAPTSLGGDLVAYKVKLGRQFWKGQGVDYASGMNWLFRRFGQAIGSTRTQSMLVGVGDKVTYPLALVGAFTAGYNASILAQCALGIIQ